MDHQIGYLDILKQKQYLKLIIANVISRFGDSIDAIAFTWLVYQVSHSAAWSSLIFGINFIPTIFIQPFAGAIVERINKKRIMILCDLIRGGIMIGIASLYLFDHLTIWILFISVILNSTVEAFRNPASTAITPKLLKAEHYEFGISLNSSVCKIVEIIGLAVAGGIIYLFGIYTAIYIDALTFIFSGFIILFIRVTEDHKEKVPLNIHTYFEDLKGGFLYLKESKALLSLCIIAFFINALIVPLNALQAALTEEVYHQDSKVLSVLGIAVSIGIGLASYLYPYLKRRLSSKVVFTIGLLLSGVFYIGMIGIRVISNHLLLLLTLVGLFSFILGFGAGLMSSNLSVCFVKVVKQEYMARASSMLNALGCACIPITSGILSICIGFTSVPIMFIIFGTLTIITAILFLMVRMYREL